MSVSQLWIRSSSWKQETDNRTIPWLMLTKVQGVILMYTAKYLLPTFIYSAFFLFKKNPGDQSLLGRHAYTLGLHMRWFFFVIFAFDLAGVHIYGFLSPIWKESSAVWPWVSILLTDSHPPAPEQRLILPCVPFYFCARSFVPQAKDHKIQLQEEEVDIGGGGR